MTLIVLAVKKFFWCSIFTAMVLGTLNNYSPTYRSLVANLTPDEVTMEGVAILEGEAIDKSLKSITEDVKKLVEDYQKYEAKIIKETVENNPSKTNYTKKEAEYIRYKALQQYPDGTKDKIKLKKETINFMKKQIGKHKLDGLEVDCLIGNLNMKEEIVREFLKIIILKEV